MPKRIEKVNSLLEHEIGKILQREIRLPNTMATLHHVATTPNLIEARAYVSVYPEEKTKEYFAILKKALPFIQHEINESVNMRPVPKIIFLKSDDAKEADRVEQLLNQLKKEEK